MIPTDIKDWVSITNWVVTGVISVVLFVVKYDKSNTRRMDDLESLIVEKTAQHKARLDVLDEKLKHVPSSSETAALTERIDALNAVIQTLQKTVERQNDFLMTSK